MTDPQMTKWTTTNDVEMESNNNNNTTPLREYKRIHIKVESRETTDVNMWPLLFSFCSCLDSPFQPVLTKSDKNVC